MSFPSGERKIPAELRQENKRMVDKSIRQIQRERKGLKTQQMKLTDEIKKSAKQGEMRAVIVMAQDLIRTRHHLGDLCKLNAGLRILRSEESIQAMGDAMKRIIEDVSEINRELNLPSLQKIMHEFERQNEKMELTSKLMADAIDDALEGDAEKEETEERCSERLRLDSPRR
ncbi:hypothetical protein OROHE_005388 [Orobanche hederae]